MRNEYSFKKMQYKRKGTNITGMSKVYIRDEEEREREKRERYPIQKKFHCNFSIENWHMEIHRISMKLHRNSS
jgi:hypothetical protein